MKAIVLGKCCPRTDALLVALAQKAFNTVAGLATKGGTMSVQNVAKFANVIGSGPGEADGVLVIADKIGLDHRLCQEALGCSRVVKLHGKGGKQTSIPANQLNKILSAT